MGTNTKEFDTHPNVGADPNVGIDPEDVQMHFFCVERS
jgi:hypothetical protein